MSYEKPSITDLGGLGELTLGTGVGLAEDGAAKSTTVVVGDVVEVSLTLLPNG